jgi:hypothetical protein
MRAYLLREHGREIQAFHGSFVDSYLDPRKAEESRQDAEPYFVARLPYLLKESGRERDLEKLLSRNRAVPSGPPSRPIRVRFGRSSKWTKSGSPLPEPTA